MGGRRGPPLRMISGLDRNGRGRRPHRPIVWLPPIRPFLRLPPNLRRRCRGGSPCPPVREKRYPLQKKAATRGGSGFFGWLMAYKIKIISSLHECYSIFTQTLLHLYTNVTPSLRGKLLHLYADGLGLYFLAVLVGDDTVHVAAVDLGGHLHAVGGLGDGRLAVLFGACVLDVPSVL